MPDTPPPPLAPEHRRLEGPQDYEQAVDLVIRQARRNLRIFSYSLRGEGYNSLARIEALQNFLLMNRANRLTIVLHDTDYLTRECPRMMNLLQQFSHAISVYQTSDEARSISDPFIIADNDHYLHRFHYDHPRAALALNDKEGALELARRFNVIVETSELAAPPTTLGL
ncbi:MAG: hypothetical protein Q8O38_04320 [Sulfurimicrobium sp.]|nr:hypothetical protein [Sulfurimicrobium sp.]